MFDNRIDTIPISRLAVPMSRALVIATKRVAETTWNREAEKWDHLKHLKISSVLGSQTKRIKALNTPADVYVINRENVTWLVDYYRNDWPFDMVVIDESSSFKNHQSKWFKALRLVSSKTKRIVELTGMPAPNTLIDLWAQIYLLDNGQRLGKTIGGFRERYFNPDQRNAERIFNYKPKAGTEESIRKVLSDICISMKASDYLELPSVSVVDVPVVLDSKARKVYDTMAKQMLLEVDTGTIDVTSAAALSNKLLQLANGAVYDEEHRAIKIHDCKLDAFMDLVEGLNGRHALVFYNFQHDRSRIMSALEKSDLVVRIYDGPQAERDWNAGRIDILLAHPASTAYGLNLQDGGYNIIWFEQWRESLTKEQREAMGLHVRQMKNSLADKKQYEKYISVLGKENVPKTFDLFQGLKYNDSEKWNGLKLAYKDKNLQNRIRTEYNLKIHEGKQGKHILGHNNYTEGRSYLTISVEEAQELVNKYAGTGKINRYPNSGKWDNTETIMSHKVIGYSLNEIDSSKTETKSFKIHYSKKGAHIVPRKE